MSAIEWTYKRLVRPRIFRASEQDAEIAHEWGLEKLQMLQESPSLTWLTKQFLTYHHPMLETKVFGIRFPNPLGLAAGFDKYCQVYWRAIPMCGWGFCEVGCITQHAQPGNDRPRIQRSEHDKALWNFMGFNNPGADGAAKTMAGIHRAHSTLPIPVGLNVGKSKITSLEDAVADYCYTVNAQWPFIDFIVLNPSSPNTPGLRELQKKQALKGLIEGVQEINIRNAKLYRSSPLPLGIKISPDESDEQLTDIVNVCRETRIDFIIVTNTTLRREHLNWDIPPDRGGVSGSPLANSSTHVLKKLYRELKGSIPLIGVGGIMDGDALYLKIINGANLCQAYTAWPFEGPDFVKRALKRLVRRLKSDGFKNVKEAVGAAL